MAVLVVKVFVAQALAFVATRQCNREKAEMATPRNSGSRGSATRAVSLPATGRHGNIASSSKQYGQSIEEGLAIRLATSSSSQADAVLKRASDDACHWWRRLKTSWTRVWPT